MRISGFFVVLLATSVFSSRPPNIIILVSDDLGFNDVSWHNDIVISPNLDTLAREGIILEQHYCQTMCSPTRGALLTGRYPIHTGLHSVLQSLVPYGLDTSFTTLADEFLRVNYSTHAVGKWHLGMCNKNYWPTNRGFQHHFGYLVGSEDYYSHIKDDGYDFRDDEEVFLSHGTYSTFLFEQRAVEVIKEHDPNRPLFLYVPFQSVHTPLQVPIEYSSMYSFINNSLPRQQLLGMMTAMDEAVGNIVNSLKDAGLYEESIIVFMSDNGGPVGRKGANNWPLRGQKGGLWEGGTRTPSFIHFPKMLKPRVEEGLFHVTDWFPTLLTAAGASTSSQDLDGVDQWAGLLDPSAGRPRREMVYHVTHEEIGAPPRAAIRVGDWKYIWRETAYNGWFQPPEQGGEQPKDDIKETTDDIRNVLYNLATDPLEKEDMSDIYPERAEEMLKKLKDYIGNMVNVTYPPATDAGYPSNFNGIWSSGWC